MSEAVELQESINNSESTNIPNLDPLVQNINNWNKKNVVIITKSIEQKIPDILSFLRNNENLAVNKISIVKYLENLFLTININSEIFLRKQSSDSRKLNLYDIIIEQYITYTNSYNSPNEEIEYRNELLNLFAILLSQVTISRESYHYILSFLLKYINEKNNNLDLTEEENGKIFNLTAEHLSRILILIQKFYQFLDESKLSLNFFYFSGESGSSITIQNKNSSKDNKKILGLEDNLCVLMFIRLFPSELIKKSLFKEEFNLLELKFNDKNKDKDISINIDMDNNLMTSFTSGGISKFTENSTNCLLVKFKKKKKIKVKIYLNGRKIYYNKDKEKEKEKEKDKDKDKEEIKEIVLFRNFIGICYNFLIFKNKKKEILPKFLENELKKNIIETIPNIKEDELRTKLKIPQNRSIYYNGFIKEELIFPFIKAELKEEIEPNILNNLFNDNNFVANVNDIKDFIEKLIAIYIPTRVSIPPTCSNNTIMNTPQLILEDSINGLNAEFVTKSPTLNGVHIYKRMIDDFGPIGGLNNLLPIIEIMIKYQDLLTKENLENFFDILISVFVPQYQKALIKEKNSNFFLYLSYFFEKIPEKFYDNGLIGIFKSISSFLTTQMNENDELVNITNQFHNNILMNDKIFFKFDYNEQIEMIEIMTNVMRNIDKDKRINIDIIKIINLLLQLDKNKNNLFCCKYHSEYFIEKYEIMNPELYTKLEPIEELLNLLFLEFKEKVANHDPSSGEDGKNLAKIFTLLSYDISPCIQKMIIRIFSNFLGNYFNCFFLLDKEEQLLNICLFILKSSVFDIKEDIIKLIFIILKNKNEKYVINEQKFDFIINNILPFYLFEDNELLKITSVENNDNKEEGNELMLKNFCSQEYTFPQKIEEIPNIEKEYGSNLDQKISINNYFEKDQVIEEDIINLIKKDTSNESSIYKEMYGEEDLNNSNSRQNGIKLTTMINDVKYSLPIVDQKKLKIHSIYNKKKLDLLINNLFNIIINFFHEEVSRKLCLNLLTKIVSKGDMILVSSFLEKLQFEINSIKPEDNKKLEEIYDNQNLIQWLIETCFQATLIKDSKLDPTIFFPGFNINVYKKEKVENNIEGNEIQTSEKEISYTNEEKIVIIYKIIKISKTILKDIFNKNIYKMDYIFTWSKYFYELRNETNNFKSVRELVFEFMMEVGYNYLKDSSNPDINNYEQKMTNYFFNLLFEFVTFYKLKQEDLDEYQKDSSIYQELSTNLKHILVSKMDDCRDSLRPIDIQENIDSKFDEYPFFKIIFDNWTPLWKGFNKQEKEEKEFYSKCLSIKKNIYINELELLFYNFNDIKEFKEISKKNIYVNKGIPLIYIMYHFFTLIFSIGGNEVEIREFFNEFRLFLRLVIISSSTLSTPGIGKKKKWPSEEQYKNVQQTIEAILFNFLYYLFSKIKETKEKIKELEETQGNLDDNEKKYLHYLKQINILLIENLGYFLKILNKIYREIKKEDEKNYGVGGFFKGIKYLFVEYEGVKKSGGFKLIESIYAECPNLSSNNKNCLDEISKLNFNDKEFLINSTSKADTQEKDKNTLFLKLEEYINIFIEDEQIEKFFQNHLENYKKLLFPFVSYISLRRDNIRNIIPMYDNRPNITFYPKNLCLVPDYFPQNSFDEALIKNIESVNKVLYTDLQLNQKKSEIDEQCKSHNYKKEKKKLFSFTGIWSVKDFFYNKQKYRLKYRLLNHNSIDYTRVLLTPIIDVDYYLPEFSKFNPVNLFRKMDYKSICKVTDLSYDIVKRPPEIDDKKSKKSKQDKIDNNTPLKEPKKEENIIPSQAENPSPTLNQISENINKIEENKNYNALYYLGQENFSFLNEKEKKENENIHELLFLSYIQKKHCIDQDKNFLQANACLVRLAFHIRGVIFINCEGIGFYSFEAKRAGDEEDYDSDRKVCFGSVFRPQTGRYKNYFLNIPFNKIQFILKRRYFFKKTALEIFTEDRKSYLFRIDDKKIKFFLESIKFYFKQDLEEITIEFNKFDDKIGFVNKKNIFMNTNLHLLANEKKYMNLKTIYEKWIKWEISTLRLIMIMNLYSNRSYNDINQYPVFPWIITDYISQNFPNFEDTKFIRPMGKPMGMMDFTEEAKERKENYEEHWKSNENDEDRDDNYDRYGSHYSTSLYLTYYMVRVFPYSYIRIELQGKNFDDPNRLFNSLPNSFDCAITQKSDLRELIPEFFVFPEMFMNMNELNLGEINDEKGKLKLVGGVEMPIWANYNEYNFVEKHRELLESSEINEKINEWFNIIFGSKQKGKEAKKIGNLFIKQTYEDFEETYNKSSKSEKIYQCRMVEFGVTPNQLFKGDTYKRQNLNDLGKIKRSLLFNILQKKNKKIEITGKEWDLEEIKVNIEENIFKMFIFLVRKKDKKKERLYLLSHNKVKIYTKYDKNQLFKSTKEKDKDKDKENYKEKEEINKENDELKDMNSGDILEEEDEIKEENDLNPSIGPMDRHERKISSGKEQSKVNIYPKFDKKFTLPKYRMRYSESPTILYDGGFYAAFGGFWNGDIILKQLIDIKIDSKKNKTKKINIIKTGGLSPITKIIIEKTETIVICCNEDGIIFTYIIDPVDKLTWHLHKIINEGQGKISSIALNENLSIFMACFKNGYCMVYTFPNCKLFNSFRIEENVLNSNKLANKDNNEPNIETENSTPSPISNEIYSSDIAIISNSPLPCYVFYLKKRKSLCVYSINAHFLNEIILGYDICENGIKKYTDHYFRDYLFIYNSLNNTIDVHRLVDLDLVISSPVINYQFVDFQFTKDLDYAFILVKAKQKSDEKSSLHKMFILKQSPLEAGKSIF